MDFHIFLISLQALALLPSPVSHAFTKELLFEDDLIVSIIFTTSVTERLKAEFRVTCLKAEQWVPNKSGVRSSLPYRGKLLLSPQPTHLVGWDV